MLMQHSGMSAKGEPRSVVNGLIPRPLLRDYTQEDRAHRVLQGAVPDVAYVQRTPTPASERRPFKLSS